MTPNRIPEEFIPMVDRIPAASPAAFLMVPTAVAPCQAPSPLQCLYQQMYEQAVAATQKPSMRDLFAIMN